MTLKHVDFYDSEVMRSLAKVASDKGMVTPKKQEVVKQAAKASFDPTDDLYLNIVRLSEGLRSKGFNKEANSLDEKLARLKRAEKDLKDAGEEMMDEAHPEGDVKVGPSEFGIMYTHPSASKKIQEIVKKQPTGKYASAKLSKKAQQKTADIAKQVVEAFVDNLYVPVFRLDPGKRQSLPGGDSNYEGMFTIDMTERPAKSGKSPSDYLRTANQMSKDKEEHARLAQELVGTKYRNESEVKRSFSAWLGRVYGRTEGPAKAPAAKKEIKPGEMRVPEGLVNNFRDFLKNKAIPNAIKIKDYTAESGFKTMKGLLESLKKIGEYYKFSEVKKAITKGDPGAEELKNVGGLEDYIKKTKELWKGINIKEALLTPRPGGTGAAPAAPAAKKGPSMPRGQAIKEMQQLLVKVPRVREIKDDGIWGPKTSTAIREAKDAHKDLDLKTTPSLQNAKDNVGRLKEFLKKPGAALEVKEQWYDMFEGKPIYPKDLASVKSFMNWVVPFGLRIDHITPGGLVGVKAQDLQGYILGLENAARQRKNPNYINDVVRIKNKIFETIKLFKDRKPPAPGIALQDLVIPLKELTEGPGATEVRPRPAAPGVPGAPGAGLDPKTRQAVEKAREKLGLSEAAVLELVKLLLAIKSGGKSEADLSRWFKRRQGREQRREKPREFFIDAKGYILLDVADEYSKGISGSYGMQDEIAPRDIAGGISRPGEFARKYLGHENKLPQLPSYIEKLLTDLQNAKAAYPEKNRALMREHGRRFSRCISRLLRLKNSALSQMKANGLTRQPWS